MEGMDRILQDFLEESQENLERLDQEFVTLEQHPDNKELLADIFRTIHTIKGSAGFLDLRQLERISHRTEDVLSKLRDGSLMLTDDITTCLLQAVDSIKSILIALERTGKEGEHEMESVVRNLQDIIEVNEHEVQPADETVGIPPQSSESPTIKNADAAIDKGDSDVAGSPESHTREDHDLKARHVSETVENALASVEETRIHVDINLLDHLMNLTGELVLSRNQIVKLSSGSDSLALREISQQLNVVVSELQETVMKTRMQEIRKVFGIFPRLVRDLSKLHHKDVNLVMEGQQTELDRTLIEGLKDPLTHLVRNAIDHGIELPETRRKLGKPPTGTITIHAYHEGGQVNINISDDGAGINLDAVKAKAIQQGLLSSKQAEEISDRGLLELIFRPGFSTSEVITSMSGRGVGMDVVKKNLNRIGGSIEIQTERHRGTTFKIRIPITLAIIPVLMVSANSHRFAIPQLNLEELVMLQQDNTNGKGIETIYGAEVYRLRGELLPLIRLNDVLNLPPQEVSDQGDISIVVLSVGGIRFGLVVDQVRETEEIVVKPLSSHIKQLSCYDGATILGDGKVALILNVRGLFSTAHVDIEEMQKADQVEMAHDQEELDSTQQEQRQTIVLFRTGADEYYGVPLAFVVRLEEFPASQVEHSGGREVLQYRGDVLPLIRLEKYLNIQPTPDPDILSLIVFSVEKQIGLVVHEIRDTVEISPQIDTETFKEKGILGSTIIHGHSVLIVDIHGLIEMAYPHWYKRFFISKLAEEERQQIRVLLVEDSMFFLNIEQSYLESAGYQVITALNGKEALAKLETHPVDVVVTDIDMPEMNGYELSRAIRASEEWKDLPVMALTSLSGEENRRKGVDAGIDEYQIKLDRDDVLRVLEALIIRKRKARLV